MAGSQGWVYLTEQRGLPAATLDRAVQAEVLAGLHFVVFAMLMLPKVALLLASGTSSQHPLVV